ncbi:MAG: substrate-binding domain-containing protein [Chloroflexota bacterium]
MNLSRRKFLQLSSMAVAGAALVACAPATPDSGSGDGGGEAAAEAVEITYLIRSDIGIKIQEWTDAAIDEFHELNPGIQVETIGVPWGDYNAKLLAMYASGAPPEISANYAAGFPTFYANDAILALDEFIASSDANISSIDEAAVASVTREGQLWALPLAHLPTVLYYNKDIFDEAGVEAPPMDWTDTSWTTDAVLERATGVSTDIDDPANAVWGSIFGNGQLGVFGWLWGIDPFSGNSGPEETEAYKTGIVTEVHYDHPTMAQFIQWVRDLTYVHQVSPRPSDTDAIQQTVGWPMMSGRIGMAINGLWSVTNFAAVEPSWNWGIAPFPYGVSGANTSPLFNDSWMLSAGTPHPEEGFELLKYLGLGNGAKLYAEISGFFPANKDNYSVWFDSTMSIPNIVHTREELETVVLDAFTYGYVTPGKTLDSYPEWNRAFNQTIGPVWNDEATPEEGLQAVQAQFESIIASKA